MHLFNCVLTNISFLIFLCSLWMAGLFVLMKQERDCVPGQASSQAADSVDPEAEADEVIPEVDLWI